VKVGRRIGQHELSFDLFTSRRMRVVRQTGTGPETAVRLLVSRMGLRFSLKNKNLPGSPDLANRKQKWAVFVQGCFWHAHAGCPKATLPKRNRAYWIEKFASNCARDRRASRALRRLGYRVLTVWQCQLVPERLVAVRRRLRSNLLHADSPARTGRGLGQPVPMHGDAARADSA
jgi:DNA mismatch endonuclease, patch repair protein